MYKGPITFAGVIAAAWGIIGLSALLVFASWRLGLNSIAALKMPLSWVHWSVFIIFLIFMLYSEGYKGFQKSFAPRFAARAKYLLHHTTPVQLLLAPLFCMSYFHAPKRRIIATLTLTIAIIIFVLLFRLLPQPWRGLLDAGVVAGLVWGIIASMLFCIKAFIGSTFSWDAEVLINPAVNK